MFKASETIWKKKSIPSVKRCYIAPVLVIPLAIANVNALALVLVLATGCFNDKTSHTYEYEIWRLIK